LFGGLLFFVSQLDAQDIGLQYIQALKAQQT